MEFPSEPLVSIVIPTHNRAGYLPKVLRSALEQTYSRLEILVLDDASTDETPDVVAPFQEKDPRIVYRRHPENLGLVENWRYGVEAARGAFFCILGDDDTLEPRFVEALLEPLLADEELVLSFSDHWIMNASGRLLQEESRANTRRWRRDHLPRGRVAQFRDVALVNRSIFIGSALFRRSLVEPSFFEARARAFIDVWLLSRCACVGEAYYLPERLATCRWQAGGVSRSWNWRIYGFKGEIFCYRQFLKDPALAGYADIFRIRLAHALVAFGYTLLTSGRHSKAREQFAAALEIQRSVRAAIGYGVSCLGPLGAALARGYRALRLSVSSRHTYQNYPEGDLSPASAYPAPMRQAAVEDDQPVVREKSTMVVL